ncbi:TPA: AAA family ATPase [Stenotrophomonas maltophilia]|nr:AAA family ATPase [Stenotrophomonas maltophilia]
MTNNTQNMPALRIDRLDLSNFRCFPKLSIEFHERLTVVVANNGQGKTAILDAVAIALGPFVGAFDDGKDRTFERDDIRLLRTGAGNRMELADGGVTLEATGVVSHSYASWKRQLAGPKSRTTRKDAQALIDAGKKLQSQVRQEIETETTSTCLPLVAYYPTDRLWNIRRLPYKKLPRTSRMVGYTHCLESGSDFHLMADWFRYWSVNSLNRRLKAQQEGRPILPGEFDDALEAVRSAINLCLEQSGWRDMDYSLEREEIVARHIQNGELPLGMLSDGIRSMLTLVADIAFRTVKLNPNLGPYAATHTHGIVLIDEVDMHLHPRWQQTVLSSLREAFPRIQFIVTTHSPQLLTSVPAECIRLLQRDVDSETGKPQANVQEFQMQTQGVASSTILAEVMDTDPVPDIEPVQWLSHYMALIEQSDEDSDEGIELRSKLDHHFGESHQLMLECDRLIRLQVYRTSLRAKKSLGSMEGEV